MTSVPPEPQAGRAPSLNAVELHAVAALWKRGAHEIVARFMGVSMLPTIAPGTEVLVRCDDAVAVGDVVAWIHGDRLVVHRVVGAGPGWLLTCGDASWLPDPPVTRTGDLVGRIVGTRQSGQWKALPTAPPSRRRALVIAICVLVARRSPWLSGALVRVLLSSRRWLYYAPRVAAARLLGRGGPGAGSR